MNVAFVEEKVLRCQPAIDVAVMESWLLKMERLPIPVLHATEPVQRRALQRVQPVKVTKQ